MIQTMYFDLGNVLVFFSHDKMYSQLSELLGLPAKSIRKLFLEDQLAYRYETGQISTEELYKTFAKLAKKPFSLEEFLLAAAEIFIPNTEIFPLIEAMKTQHIRLILLSNTSECHFQYVCQHYPILQTFDEWVLSYKTGACKPNPAIFQKALSLAQCPKEHCFFTDDIPQYVEAAKQSGLDSEVFSGVPQLKSHLAHRGVNIDYT